MKYLFAGLIALLAVLIVAFVLVMLSEEKEEAAVSVAYSGAAPVPSMLYPQNASGTPRVYLEDVMTGNQFCAEMNKQQIVGRMVPGGINLNDVAISSSSYVSRQHFRLFVANNSVLLENLSKSGTEVNGIPVGDPVALRRGDLIKAGDIQIRVIGIE